MGTIAKGRVSSQDGGPRVNIRLHAGCHHPLNHTLPIKRHSKCPAITVVHVFASGCTEVLLLFKNCQFLGPESNFTPLVVLLLEL